MLEALLGFVADSSLATALKGSRNAYPVVNAVHIIAIATLFGSILALDLRLLGIARSVPARPLALYLPRLAAGGLAIAALSGLLLFSVQPFDYVDNRAFLIKISLVAAGAAHALVVHASRGWRCLVQRDGMIGGGLKASALLSLAIWVAAILAGRFIAF